MTIHSFTFENFFSFEAKTDVSFVMDKRSVLDDTVFETSADVRLSKVLAVVGANGSGKTNLIKPLAFLLWFMTDSFFGKNNTHARFVRPHILHENDCVKFAIDFEVDGKRYRYILLMGGAQVWGESLEKKTSRLWSKLFVRTWNGEGKKYEVIRKGFGSANLPLEDADGQVSLISLAGQYKSKIALSICEKLRKRVTNVSGFGRDTTYLELQTATRYYIESFVAKEEMLRFLRNQDFGVSDIQYEEYEKRSPDGDIEKSFIPWVIYKRGDAEAKIPLVLESSGTQSVYNLLSKIIPLLQTGGVMIYDELEGDLHPLMLEPLLSLFFSKRTNPYNAQIIFTTHSIEVLNLLKKNQIILVEKHEGASEAWKLSDMEGVRSDDNFYAKYMSGAYGAIPRI